MRAGAVPDSDALRETCADGPGPLHDAREQPSADGIRARQGYGARAAFSASHRRDGTCSVRPVYGLRHAAPPFYVSPFWNSSDWRFCASHFCERGGKRD